MAPRVTGSRNDTKTGLDLDRYINVEDDLSVPLHGCVVLMDYSSRTEVAREPASVGYVVPMG